MKPPEKKAIFTSRLNDSALLQSAHRKPDAANQTCNQPQQQLHQWIPTPHPHASGQARQAATARGTQDSLDNLEDLDGLVDVPEECLGISGQCWESR